MDLEKTPGLTESARDVVAAYEEAHFLHAGAVMDAALNASGAEERAEGFGQWKVVTCSHKLGRRPPRPVGAVLTLLMVGVGVSLLFVNGSLPSC